MKHELRIKAEILREPERRWILWTKFPELLANLKENGGNYRGMWKLSVSEVDLVV